MERMRGDCCYHERMQLSGRHILIGVTGGIAAYKTPILVRHLCNCGAEVQVVMTRGALEFATPASLQAVSGRPVRTDLWDRQAEAAMSHIELARWAERILIAPATAHFLAVLAGGLAPDLLSTLCLAKRAPGILAPAMNQAMWRAPSTARNVAALRADGWLLVGPDEGEQACGDVGPGRMAEPEELARAVQRSFVAPALAGRRVLVTAGPTLEAIDPVRCLSNRSSGKQGYAVAAAAAAAGAEVTLVSGPCALPAPPVAQCIQVASAQEMHDAVHAHLAGQDLFIGVAAVSDYRPIRPRQRKIKKQGGQGLSVQLEQNPDIIASVAASPNPPVVVGFAAETEQPLARAREKRRRKGLDAIVVNDLSRPGIGFDSDRNAATLIWNGGELNFPCQSKQDLASGLIGQLADLFADRLAGASAESAAG